MQAFKKAKKIQSFVQCLDFFSSQKEAFFLVNDFDSPLFEIDNTYQACLKLTMAAENGKQYCKHSQLCGKMYFTKAEKTNFES